MGGGKGASRLKEEHQKRGNGVEKRADVESGLVLGREPYGLSMSREKGEDQRDLI